MTVEIRIIDSLDGFQAIQREWNHLYDNCPNATIFLSWDWMFTWWEVFNKAINSQLFIICLYENEQLIGLAPFHITNSFPKSLIQGRTISFIGCGEEIQDKIVSQYSDFLVSPKNTEQMILSVSNYLLEVKNQWDFSDFSFLLEDSIISQCFKANKSEIHTNLTQYGTRFYIPEVQNFDDFLDKMENRWSKMYKKKSRKLDSAGDVKIESTSDVESSKNGYKLLSSMHEARWKNRTDVSIFKSKLFNEFHLKLLERLVPQNKAAINTLYLNEEALASYYYFTDKSQVHYYQSGFYSENANRYSPLFILVCKEIGLTIKNKILFDFMFDEDPNSYKKEQYATQSKPMYRLMWSPYKSRMTKHRYAKILQTKYFNLKNNSLNIF